MFSLTWYNIQSKNLIISDRIETIFSMFWLLREKNENYGFQMHNLICNYRIMIKSGIQNLEIYSSPLRGLLKENKFYLIKNEEEKEISLEEFADMLLVNFPKDIPWEEMKKLNDKYKGTGRNNVKINSEIKTIEEWRREDLYLEIGDYLKKEKYYASLKGD